MPSAEVENAQHLTAHGDFTIFIVTEDQFGYALFLAQCGGRHRDTKPLSGFSGAGVLEIVKDLRGDTYRAVYTVQLGNTVYVLHAFQEKSKTGIETPSRDKQLIDQRFSEAVKIAKERGDV